MPTNAFAAEPVPQPLVSSVRVERFRSIVDLTLELGRVTVIVGANGSGKSNVLEAIATGSAAAAGKLSHEFLAARGIRPLSPEYLRPRFSGLDPEATLLTIGAGVGGWTFKTRLGFTGDGELHNSLFVLDNEFAPRVAELVRMFEAQGLPHPPDWEGTPFEAMIDGPRLLGLATFLILTPDYPSLRTFADEGQILPLGVRGEGLFKHLVDLSRKSPALLDRLSERLRVLDWFDGFVIPNDLGPGEKRLAIRDRYLEQDVLLDQRAANEGFLFLLFVYVLLSSPSAPRFFAIDNVDTSLNPKLCARMMADLVALAREHDKQVILTTHNPALLDGLDLSDDTQRLVVCERNLDGHTTVRRVEAPANPGTRLSEAFLRGYLGGLPGSF